MIVIPNEGKILALERWLAPDVATGEDWIVKTYSNNYTPVAGSSSGNFTESAYTGYLAVHVTEADWGAAAITSDVAYSTSSLTPSYTCTAGTEAVYGWYAVGAISGKVLAAERFSTTLTTVPGATITLSPFKIAFQTLH